ncbi:MAG: DUF350 domain-containing protein [Calditrichales bacterium]|nr:MAG: DUF350 domain-containing protein [Calditrichales bacterium]
MAPDQFIITVINLLIFFFIILVAKYVYGWLHPHFNLQNQLPEKDNPALAFAVTGYYLGLTFIIGGAIHTAGSGLLTNTIQLVFYGLIGIILLNLSSMVNDKLILRKFANLKMVVVDRNTGTGVVVGANYLANGIIMFGALSGPGSTLATAIVFWLIGQITLIIAVTIYDLITPFELQAEIEKDNIAVSISVAGVLIGIGLLIASAINVEFISWSDHFSRIGYYFAGGVIMLPVLRFISDKTILAGRRLTDELVNLEVPNTGAGLLEAFLYVGTALIIGWTI